MKEILITEDMVLEQTIALDLHWWIEENKDYLFKYTNGIDRVSEITLAVRESMKKAREKIANLPEPLPYLYCKKVGCCTKSKDETTSSCVREGLPTGEGEATSSPGLEKTQ